LHILCTISFVNLLLLFRAKVFGEMRRRSYGLGIWNQWFGIWLGISKICQM
jgi:hypothetical protein